MTSAQFLDNTFFAYFFTTGDYLASLIGLVLVASIVLAILNFFWKP